MIESDKKHKKPRELVLAKQLMKEGKFVEARALTDLENVCWACNAPMDQSKPIKPYKDEEGIDLKISGKDQKEVKK